MKRHNAWSALVATSCTLLAMGCAQSNPNFAPNLGGPAASPHATVAMGRVYEQQGNHLKANQFYQQALSENPHEVEAHRRLAIIACKKEDWASAENHFTKALTENPQDVRILNDFGYALYLQQRHEDAEPLLRKVLELDPKNERAGINLGLVLGSQERLLESFQTFMEFGSEAEAYTNLAFVHTALGNLEEAEKSYYKAISLDENLEPAIEGLAQLASRKKAHVQTKGSFPKSSPSLGPTPSQGSLIAEMKISPHDPSRFPESLYSEVRPVRPIEKDLVKALPEQSEPVRTLEEVQLANASNTQTAETVGRFASVKSQTAETNRLIASVHETREPELAFSTEESVTYAVPARLADGDEDCPTHGCDVPFPEPKAKVVRSEPAAADLEIVAKLEQEDFAPVTPARLARSTSNEPKTEALASIVQPLPRMGGFAEAEQTSSFDDATVIPLPDHPELTQVPQQHEPRPMTREELEATPIRSLPGLQTSPGATVGIDLDEPYATPIIGVREVRSESAFDEAPTKPITTFPSDRPESTPIRPMPAPGEVTRISYEASSSNRPQLGQTTQLQLPAENKPGLSGFDTTTQPTNLEMPSMGHASASDGNLPSAPTPE